MSDVAPPKIATASTWWVQIRGKAFGPYSLEQMARFLAEGRVRSTTMVSQQPDGEWVESRRFPELRGMRAPQASNDAGVEAARAPVGAPSFVRVPTSRSRSIV